MLVFGPKAQRDPIIQILMYWGLHCAHEAKNLRVVLDSDLSFAKHFNNRVETGFYQIRNTAEIRTMIAFATSNPHSCFFSWLKKSLTQLVQNHDIILLQFLLLCTGYMWCLEFMLKLYSLFFLDHLINRYFLCPEQNWRQRVIDLFLLLIFTFCILFVLCILCFDFMMWCKARCNQGYCS